MKVRPNTGAPQNQDVDEDLVSMLIRAPKRMPGGGRTDLLPSSARDRILVVASRALAELGRVGRQLPKSAPAPKMCLERTAWRGSPNMPGELGEPWRSRSYINREPPKQSLDAPSRRLVSSQIWKMGVSKGRPRLLQRQGARPRSRSTANGAGEAGGAPSQCWAMS